MSVQKMTKTDEVKNLSSLDMPEPLTAFSLKRPRVRIYMLAPLQFGGGGEASAIGLANFLVSRGLHVELYYDSSNNDIKRKDDKLFRKEIKFEYLSDEYLHFLRLPLSKQLFHPLPRLVRNEKETINLIFIFRLPPLKYLKQIVNNNAKVIFLLHGISLEDRSPPNLYVVAYQIFLRLQLTRTSRLLRMDNFHFQALTQNLGKKLINFGIKSDQIAVIPSWFVDCEKYIVGNNEDEFTVLFMARMERLQKGLDLLVNIIKKLAKAGPLAHFRFLLIGSGTDYSMVENLSKSYDFVKIAGYLSEEEKIKAFSECNLMVNTSFVEPWGLTIVESLFSGLFILSTPVAGPREILSESTAFGEILGFGAKGFVKSILYQYDKWLKSKADFYQEKLHRREKAIELHGKNIVWEQYYRFIDDVYGNDQ